MAERPNIVVVMGDDHAQWAARCYGNSELITPAMDYLAATGVRMANAFTPTPVCSPARASFWTGLLPSQHGVHDFVRDLDEDSGTRDWLHDTVTLAQLMHDAGYQCALVGKWHCGREDHRPAGFDEWFTSGRQIPAHAGRHTFVHNGRSLELSGPMTQILTDQAIRVLRERDVQRPFFLFVGYSATHSPWSGHPERLVEAYRRCTFRDIPSDVTYPFGRMALESTRPTRVNPREALAQYYAAVTEIDEGLGRLIGELEGQGLRENTLVVYTADHGLNCGHHGIWGKGNGTRPQNMVEESIRIPLIFNLPGTLFAQQVRAEFVDHCDLFATLLEYGGVPLPDAALAYPGRSYLPLLTNSCPVPDWKNEQFGEYGNLRMVRTRTHKLIRRYPDGPSELFDLTTDPRETVNLFGVLGQQEMIDSLTAALNASFARYEDPTKSGLRVHELPRPNRMEAWRDEPG